VLRSVVTGLLLAGAALAATSASAATDPPLGPVMDVANLRGLRHLALAINGDETPAAVAARTEAETTLKETGHDVTLLPAARISLPPDRAMLDVAARYAADALVLVEVPPGYGADAIWIAVYDMTGARLLAYGGRRVSPVVPLAPVASPATVGGFDPRVLPFVEGPEFYRAVGRPDLARRYESRRATKTIMRVGGGILLAGGILVGLIDAAGSAVQNTVYTAGCVTGSATDCASSSSPSSAPWVVALIGLGLVVTPAFIATDPLGPAEKAALLTSVTSAVPRPSLSLSVAPALAPGGGTLTVGGRF
jgi:hypothetical protein